MFGEKVEILEKKGRQWVKIRCLWDHTIGWVDARQICPISADTATDSNFAYCLDLVQPVMSEHFHLPVTLGARLPGFDGLRFELDGRQFTFSGQAVFPQNLPADADLVLKIARKYLFAPFQRGGRSPFGIDASGLTQNVFRMVGINLPREAREQVLHGDPVHFIEQAQIGDLAFFENRRGIINHVGLLLPDGQILHAAGRVRIDKLDHFGIYNEESRRYTHFLRIIRRLLRPAPVQPPKAPAMEAVPHNQVELF
ncbi:MAG: hypothetical protein D6714_03870 [Bacteroidetes bacterium]|nr:MAG: hypothetical protein D6714_03870 [Bacteroidota bacterium]